MQEGVVVAGVAMSHASYSFDAEYSYVVPEELEGKIREGIRVLVPFGSGNRKVIGFVTSLGTVPERGKLKSIIRPVDAESLLTPEMLGMIRWLKETTFCTFYDAFRTVVPSGYSYKVQLHYSLVNTFVDENELSEKEAEVIAFMQSTASQSEIDTYFETDPARRKTADSLIDKGYVEETDSLKRKVGDESVKMAALSDEYYNGTDFGLTAKQKKVAELLEECTSASEKEICYMVGCTQTIIKRMAAKGVIREFENESLRDAVGEIDEREDPDRIVLNEEQKRAFEGIIDLINSGKPAGALLYGVTGSGKTSVFIKVIDAVLKMGKTAVLLVPEISLTPQMVSRFKRLFGKGVGLLHSSLSVGQRLDEFKRIKRGEARVVIGTRSAVFAPVSDLGVIIMDEEGEQSYKSDSSPRYHAREAAKKRCGYHNCLLLMASATPSLETFYNAKNGRYHLFELKKRFNEAVLPAVEMIDMQREAAEGNDSLLSRSLADKITATLQRDEQVILLLNRRGFTTYVSCASCRKPLSCPNCNIPLTYHKKNNRYMCHYCGYTMDNRMKCPSCGSDKLRQSGVGTQRVEDEIARIYPDARILRMDADTTSSRYSYEEKFRAFGEHEYDIMLGTQMIAKGLDFPRVTLVGVISLDKALFTGGYKSYERTFSLVTQVVGRSGRGDRPGTACIQTFVPDHYVLNLAAQQDYEEFYEQEMALRQTLIYPPCCDICVIGFSAVMESKAIAASNWVTQRLRDHLSENKADFPLRAIGPAPCTLEVINRRYRYRLILKTRVNKRFRDMIRAVLSDFYKCSEFKEVRIYADINGDIGL